MSLTPGTVLAERYRVDEKIGEGGIGEVWRAKNIAVGTRVAIKLLYDASKANKELVLRFRREAYLLARVRSDHVARVLDFVSDPQYGLILVLDLIEGVPLGDVLKKRKLSLEEAVDLGCDLTRGIAILHRASVVHRDLKPGNILLEDRVDGRKRAVIVDFGLGRMMKKQADDEPAGITNVDTAVGTLEYMAPEQVLNSRSVTGSADLYSLGAILHRAVTGHHVFAGVDPSKIAQSKILQEAPAVELGRDDEVGRSFGTILTRLLRRHPDERYAKAEDLLVAFTRLAKLCDRSVDLPDRQPKESQPSLPPELLDLPAAPPPMIGVKRSPGETAASKAGDSDVATKAPAPSVEPAAPSAGPSAGSESPVRPEPPPPPAGTARARNLVAIGAGVGFAVGLLVGGLAMRGAGSEDDDRAAAGEPAGAAASSASDPGSEPVAQEGRTPGFEEDGARDVPAGNSNEPPIPSSASASPPGLKDPWESSTATAAPGPMPTAPEPPPSDAVDPFSDEGQDGASDDDGDPPPAPPSEPPPSGDEPTPFEPTAP